MVRRRLHVVAAIGGCETAIGVGVGANRSRSHAAKLRQLARGGIPDGYIIFSQRKVTHNNRSGPGIVAGRFSFAAVLP